MARKKTSPKRRSECPLNASVEMLGDRWSLLIIRDMMLRGFRSYKEFLECFEGIATNILADRLRKLQDYGIVVAVRDPKDARKITYLLTAKADRNGALGGRARRHRQSGTGAANASGQAEVSGGSAATLGARVGCRVRWMRADSPSQENRTQHS